MTAREILTPEGIPLSLTVAQPGDRIAAFIADTFVLTVVRLVLLSGVMVVGGVFEKVGLLGVVVGLGLVVDFVLRNFYFVWFEIHWQGSTPGKRWLGVRVIDRSGGTLRAHSVLVRNLTREIEVWVPLAVVVLPDQLWPDAPAWAQLIAALWLICLALLPLFNRERLRVGDLIAGTIVVHASKAKLLDDVSEGGRRLRRGWRRHDFKPGQLDHYGAHELQVLEELLRRHDRDPEALRVVRERIEAKIGWAGKRRRGRDPDDDLDLDRDPDDDERFLRDFYVAQRARLEQKLLMGERQERKRA